MATLQEASQQTSGAVRADAFSAERYRDEIDRVFRRSWLFVGHDSLIPRPGDWFQSCMAEDPVIVQRDQAGRIRVYLNRCRHRGNLLAVHDRGSASTFSCSYHGWAYTDGRLSAIPMEREAYRNEIDAESMSLIEAKVAVFGGLVFASWDAEAMPLDTYLGDARWWLENFLVREDIGGLQVIPGQQRYVVPTNWKLPAENFAGDYYHFAATHGSVLGALARSDDKRVAATGATATRGPTPHYFSLAANHRQGVAHGFYEVSSGEAPRAQDRAIAERLGPEAIEWMEERERRLDERLKAFESRPYSFHAANLFPNFGLIGVGSAFYGKGLILHHPRGPLRTEAWVWCAVERNAPEVVKRHQRFVLMQRQAAAGLVAPDDHENFERITETLPGVAREVPFHYDMALGHEEDDPRPVTWRTHRSWPGRLAPRVSEVVQRDFYRHWERMMGAR